MVEKYLNTPISMTDYLEKDLKLAYRSVCLASATQPACLQVEDKEPNREERTGGGGWRL